jgi:hypothetical protein
MGGHAATEALDSLKFVQLLHVLGNFLWGGRSPLWNESDEVQQGADVLFHSPGSSSLKGRAHPALVLRPPGHFLLVP